MNDSDTTSSPSGGNRNPPKRLIHPIPEARKLLGGISHSNFYEIIKRGDLELVKIGRRSFVTDEALRRYVARLSGCEGA